jgi:hypothetical protein
LRQYIYSPAEAGVPHWPDGTLRFNQVEVTQNPDEADLFVCPGTLQLFGSREALCRFPHFAGRENRHVFFCIDESTVQYDSQALLIRCNLKTHMLSRDPNSISFPWPVENYTECIDLPEGGFKYDVSFHGWLNYSTRIESSGSCLERPDLKCDMARYPDFTGAIYSLPEGVRRRAEFRRSMRESRLALCPESIPGDFPYRFFEAMSAARVPVLVGADQVFPFADEIPYSEFALHINPGEASRVGIYIAQYLKETPDEEIIRRGKVARSWWEKLLNRDIWQESMLHAVKKKFDQFGYSY